MTQDAPLSADKVAELERRLADAAAEVARVQAELQRAQQAGDPPPGSGVPGSTVPPVPYGGAGPHVITIDGQQVTAGNGDLAAVLRQVAPAAGAGGPVVVVNGQPVSGGQPVDLSAYLTPEVRQQIQSSLHGLGLDQSLGAMFGHLGAAGEPPAPPESTYVAPLAEPPRPVPATYRLATFDLSWYELFILLIGFVAPIALWVFWPVSLPAALVAAVLGIALFRGYRYRRRIGVLKWGKVVTVTQRDTLSEGTYYGGVTYNNMRKRQANGWDVTTRWYSGPGYTNKVDFTVDGTPGTLVFRGLRYGDGVVLADPRDPSRALCVSQFPYSVKPGPDGQFTGELSVATWAGVLITLVVELSVVALAVVAVLDLWVGR